MVEINSFELENCKSSDDEQETKESIAERKNKALKEIDNAKFGCFHVRAILVSGVGFFTVIYFSI